MARGRTAAVVSLLHGAFVRPSLLPHVRRKFVPIAFTKTAAHSVRSQMAFLSGDTFFLDNFALRQWDDPKCGGTKLDFDKAQFLQRVHELFKAQGSVLVDGYAPFCKHVFVENFAGAKLGALEISDSNRWLLRTGYTRRRPEELAVLTRWFCAADVEVPVAKSLDIILYSREQIVKEYEALPGKGSPDELPDTPWGIISVKAQDEMYETPMQPITIMRNCLGKAEGGSGVPLDPAAYNESAAYWQNHASIVDGPSPNGE